VSENAGTNYDALLKRALAEIKSLKARIAAGRATSREPIAVVGIGCRFPGGADGPDAFWRLLHDGIDAITDVPADRWNADALYRHDRDTPGTMCTRWGGFVPGLDEFDADFFRISPTEAATMDPQQRLLLEVSWEALEHAGVAATALAGSEGGVFVGICSDDYYRLLASRDLEAIDPYMKSGTAHSVAAGRISYFLGLRGPSLAVDTACSSSLVAVHLACQSLRLGECEFALAGGVNRNITPETSVTFSRAGMLSPTGRCKTFDAAADGYVRGEGCGVVVLRRLKDALARGDRILAVIRGGAVNQDGRTSGLTVPSGPSQQRVVQRALDDASVSASRVSYVEAHGTGTALGDPIELGALGAIFGADRDRWVGSVKTNIGHLEGAAGIAGLIKVVLSLQRRTIPAHLHFREPSRRVDWTQLPFTVPVERVAWPGGDEPRVAGVSSFGFGGTNAHLVLEEWIADARVARTAPRGAAPQRRDHLFTSSAHTEPALRELTQRMARYLATVPEDDLGPVCFTSNAGRSPLSWRLAVRASSIAELVAGLTAWTRGEPGPWTCSDRAVDPSAGVLVDFAADGPPRVERDARITLGLDASIDRRPLDDVAALFVAGARIDWSGFHAPEDARRVDLPTYPFERQRHWFMPPATAPTATPDADQRFYHLEWQKHAAAAPPDYLATPGQVSDALTASAENHAERSALAAGYSGLTERAEAASISFILQALARLGLSLTPGARLDASALPARLGVAARQRRLFASLLEQLELQGFLARRDAGWQVVRPADGADAATAMHDVLTRHPAATTELRLLERCGSRLADVLNGTCDPLTLLFPHDQTSGAAELYRNAGGFRVMHDVLGDAVRRLVRDLPATRRIRVLEIGAGTGSATASILPHLPADRTTYAFTDVSRGFFADARRRFSAYPFVEYDVLDLERLDADAARWAQSADLVIAANVVHATRHVRRSLERLRGFMAPGGALLLLESTARRTWVELVFGLTEGWWGFEDTDLRRSHPLLGPTEWLRVLTETGFEQPTAYAPEDETVRFLAGQTLLIARAGASMPVESSGPRPEHWLVFADAGDAASALPAWLAERRISCTRIVPADTYGVRESGCVGVNAASPDDYVRLLRDHVPAGVSLAVVYGWGLKERDPEMLDTPALEAEIERVTSGVVYLSQALVPRSDAASVRLWVITRGAYQVNGDASPVALGLTPLVGLVRSLNVEHPHLRSTLIDLDLEQTLEPGALIDELWRTDAAADREIALRADGRFVPRLAPTRPVAGSAQVLRDGTYMITGAFGGIGSQIARWLARRGAKHLVLTSRRTDHPGAAALVAELEREGARVRTIAADLSRAEDAARLFAEVRRDLPPLRGVCHASMVLANALLKDMTWDLFRRAYAPKVLGAWNLHRETRDLALDWFVICSSIAAFVAEPGVANYVSAHTFVDALAGHRRSLGLPAQSLNWGVWSRTGVAAGSVERDLAAHGILGFSTEEGLAHLEAALADGRTGLVIAHVDWKSFLGPAAARPAMFARVAQPAAVESSDKTDIVERLRRAPSSERRALLLAHVQALTADVLGLPAGTALDPTRGFFDLGMDSLTSMMLRNRLQATVGCALSPTASFQHPTLERLADHLAAYVESGEDATRDPSARATAVDADDARTAVDERYLAMSEDDLADRLDRTLADLEAHQ
jgi:3-oxoacyl-(acyl-carrier-protein) synthase/NAD(P)-dependent dehydrogenase (short-subunit alcohol dehydrogenase family)/SAM-dependent methyltransferase/acyl carrier protein